MGKILLAFTAILILVSINSQGQSLNEQIYSCYINGDMDKWVIAMDKMEAEWKQTKNYDLLFDYTIAQYGYTAFCLARDKKEMAREIVETAVKNAHIMIKLNPDWAKAHALLGALYGYKVALNPRKVFAFTTNASDEIMHAQTLDPNESNVWMEKGNFDYYKPSVFGGNKKDAIRYYKKSVVLFENNRSELKHNWLYLNTLNGLAKAYIKTKKFKKADLTYKKILAIEPKLSWIRDRDYPRFLEKYGDQFN